MSVLKFVAENIPRFPVDILRVNWFMVYKRTGKYEASDKFHIKKELTELELILDYEYVLGLQNHEKIIERLFNKSCVSFNTFTDSTWIYGEDYPKLIDLP